MGIVIRGIYIEDPDNIDEATRKLINGPIAEDDADALWRAIKHRKDEIIRQDFRYSNEMMSVFRKKGKKEKTTTIG